MKRKIYHIVWRSGEWHMQRPNARLGEQVNL